MHRNGTILYANPAPGKSLDYQPMADRLNRSPAELHRMTLGNQCAIAKDRFIDDLKINAVRTGSFYSKNKFGARFYMALKSNFVEIDAHTFYRVFVLRERVQWRAGSGRR